MRRALLISLVSVFFVAIANADDVIFAAARLRLVHGKYYPLESSHLFRIGSDGSHLKQLTFGREMDTDLCVSADGKRLLFWRRDANDLVGNVRLCCAALDGSDQKVLLTFDDVDLSKAADIARALTLRRGISVRVRSGVGAKTGFVIKVSKITKPLGAFDIDVSPDGRYLRFSSEEYSGLVVDLKTGKHFEGPAGIWLDDGTLLDGSLEDGVSFYTLRSISGSFITKRRIYNIVKGKAVNCSVVTQWSRRQDDDGRKAFRLGSKGQNILLQETWRSNAGGNPAIYCFGANSGRIRFELADLFLEGVDSVRAHFLTTTWKWGRGFNCDGTVPLRKLVIWDGKSVIPRQLGFDLACCHGACFVRTAGSR